MAVETDDTLESRFPRLLSAKLELALDGGGDCSSVVAVGPLSFDSVCSSVSGSGVLVSSTVAVFGSSSDVVWTGVAFSSVWRREDDSLDVV